MPEIPHDFFTVENLSTFNGLVLFVSIVTALLKNPLKERWGDWAARPLAVAVAFLTQLVCAGRPGNLEPGNGGTGPGKRLFSSGGRQRHP